MSTTDPVDVFTAIERHFRKQHTPGCTINRIHGERKDSGDFLREVPKCEGTFLFGGQTVCQAAEMAVGKGGLQAT